ncbi:Hypothetical predicted protein [Marmota monax]|uniref:2-phosphoxylose phosphatase 1 n=1 Tax=Marmota monax TaxID=9995 RepID=A0A5E4DJE8_MARMO|nr:Hypothetical predicted protein [Marmota monax]
MALNEEVRPVSVTQQASPDHSSPHSERRMGAHGEVQPHPGLLLALPCGDCISVTCSAFPAVHLIPMSAARNGASSKSRKRIMPDPVTEPPVTDPVYEALLYCNIPRVAERSMEGHAPHHFKLISVHVLIRHGDRYPLYAIPKTKRPEIDCTLMANR